MASFFLYLCMWFETHSHTKREHVEIVIQTVLFPFLIGLLNCWIGDGFGSKSLDFRKASDRVLPRPSSNLFPSQEAPRTPAMGLLSHYLTHQEPYVLLLCITRLLCPLIGSFMRVYDIPPDCELLEVSVTPRERCYQVHNTIL